MTPIQNNLNAIREILEEKLSSWSDLDSRILNFHSTRVHLYYIATICDVEAIHKWVVAPFFELKDSTQYQSYLQTLPKSIETMDGEFIINQVLQGFVAIFSEKGVVLFDAKKVLHRLISESHSESVTQGPNDSLVENLDSNLNLIRHRYHRASLSVEQHQFGKERLPAFVLYDCQLIDPEILTQLQKRINKLYRKSLRLVQQIPQNIMSESSSLFPTLLASDRCDRIVKILPTENSSCWFKDPLRR